MELYRFQEEAIARVTRSWELGAQNTLLACPTGGGKTEIGARLVGAEHRALWVAHSRELVKQAESRLVELYGQESVGVVMPGYPHRASARIQVGTIQTLLRRELPQVDRVVIDECHHYTATEYRTLPESYRGKPTVGLTATPERSDGTRLGDVFDHLEVAAHYSQLIDLGLLVPWDVVHPPKDTLGHDLAMDPLTAWRMYARNRKTFAFYMRVYEAIDQEQWFTSHGVTTKTVHYKTGKKLRSVHVSDFIKRHVTVLNNVYALTEGVNIPEASVVLLVRPFLNRGNFVQACGRAGRAFPGKGRALLIDLCGSSHLHGSPVSDWEYTLEGRGTPEVSDGEELEPKEREYVERGPLVREVLDVGLVPAPFSASREIAQEPVTEVKQLRNAVDVEARLDAIAAKKGSHVADVIRKAYSGFAQ